MQTATQSIPMPDCWDDAGCNVVIFPAGGGRPGYGGVAGGNYPGRGDALCHTLTDFLFDTRNIICMV